MTTASQPFISSGKVVAEALRNRLKYECVKFLKEEGIENKGVAVDLFTQSSHLLAIKVFFKDLKEAIPDDRQLEIFCSKFRIMLLGFEITVII